MEAEALKEDTAVGAGVFHRRQGIHHSGGGAGAVYRGLCTCGRCRGDIPGEIEVGGDVTSASLLHNYLVSKECA